MSMRYRRLSPTGDYTWGQSQADFLTGAEAVAQAYKTRLDLPYASWWRDLEDGTPWFQNILGQSGSASNVEAVNGIILARIRTTPGHDSLLGYSGNFDSLTRSYSFQCRTQTIYSDTVVDFSGAF